jgi:FkbM family methyltransferase
MLKAAIATTVQKISPRLWLEIGIMRRDHHYEREYWLLPDLCAPDAAAVDVGGNQGQFAYYMAKLSSQVHVFEPNPICLAALERIRTRNIKIEAVALSDADGEALMRFDPNNTGIGTIEPANTLQNNAGIKEIIDAKVAFIKIDVEGHEPSVVRGGLGLIAASRPSLLIECEVRHNPTAFAELEGMLGPLGYGIYYLKDGQLHAASSADVPGLQVAPASSPAYINNFLFLPRDRGEILTALRRRLEATARR